MNFKLKQPKSEKETLIMFYSNLPNGERFNYSTGEKIHPKLWDSNYQFPVNTRVKTEQVLVNSIKLQLERYKTSFMEFEARCKAIDEDFDKTSLKEYFDSVFKKGKVSKDFFYYYDEFIELNSDLGNWGKGTTSRYWNIRKILKEFEKQSYRIEFKRIDMKWYSKFKNFCETNKRHSLNTFGRNLGLLKTFLNHAVKQGYTTKTEFKDFKAKREVIPQLTLTLQEINQLYNYDFSENKRLERVRDVFVLGCVTGMRFSDLKRIKKENVGYNEITIREVKDKSKHLKIPLVNTSREILKKYDYKLPCISDQKFRDYLKELCCLVGFNREMVYTKRIGNEVFETRYKMYERIGTHTARRSFVTNMMNQNVPDKAIMKITGHKSISTFQAYYSPTVSDTVDFMARVWDNDSDHLKVV